MTRPVPTYSLSFALREINKHLPKATMNGIKYLLKKGVIKIDPSKMSPTRSRYNLTRKEVEDIKRLVWMFYRKSEPFPEDIDI